MKSWLMVFGVVVGWQSVARAASRWDEMDYGPFLTSSLTMHPKGNAESMANVTVKGITVKLAGGKAAVCFDTNLCRYAGGWTGGWLKLYGTPFDGTHRPPERSRPTVAGALAFETATNTPGWAGKGGTFVDPREEPYVALPKAWAHYRGLYVDGDRVTFKYTVGACEVLESPSYDQGTGAFERTMKVGPNAEAMTLLVAESTADVTLDLAAATIVGLKGASLKLDGARIVLQVPPHDKVLMFKVVIHPGGAAAAAADEVVADVEQFTRGGRARYPQSIESRGALGKAEGPYAVDTLTLPDENPWKSWMRVGGFDFFDGGKSAAVCTWSGDVWIVTGIDAGLEKLTWRRFATGLFQPLGLKVVGGKVYALGRDQVTVLHDLNNDGEADFYENFNNDISVTPNFHEFVFDLQQAPDGNFFFTKGAPLLGTDFFDPVGRNNGCVMRLSKDGKTLEVYATGLRAPNGTGMGPNGEVTCSDNQGIWTPVDRLNLIKHGGFYGCVGTAHRAPPPTAYDPPVIWLPWPVENSGGGQAWVPDDRWGPFKGQMLYLSYGKSALFHVLMEEVGGVAQGSVVKFPLTFGSGIMRARFNPADGQLYVAGLKGWQTTASRDGILQRVRYTGKPVYDVVAMHVRKGEIELTFTQPLNAQSAGDARNYDIQWWNYLWSKKYGSSDFKVSDPKKTGRDTLEVKAAKVSADGKTVSLDVPGLDRPVMQIVTKFKVEAADRTPMSLEIDGTINRLP